jgi:hypothetical protein
MRYLIILTVLPVCVLQGMSLHPSHIHDLAKINIPEEVKQERVRALMSLANKTAGQEGYQAFNALVQACEKNALDALQQNHLTVLAKFKLVENGDFTQGTYQTVLKRCFKNNGAYDLHVIAADVSFPQDSEIAELVVLKNGSVYKKEAVENIKKVFEQLVFDEKHELLGSLYLFAQFATQMRTETLNQLQHYKLITEAGVSKLLVDVSFCSIHPGINQAGNYRIVNPIASCSKQLITEAKKKLTKAERKHQ